MSMDEMEDFRKTHYTKDIIPELIGKEVILGG
ncbi:unnamed protein product, partial [marine sediment metagenome]